MKGLTILLPSLKNLGGRELLILGDFNLDENKKYHQDYSHRSRTYYEELINTFEPAGLHQLVEFETWSRLVNGVWRSSILDHVYIADMSKVSSLKPLESIIGDHRIVMLEIFGKKEALKTSFKRDW